MGRNKTNLKVELYLTDNLEIWYQLIVDAAQSSVRYDNLIEWRSRRWWSKAPNERFLAITTPRLRWLSPVTHEWPHHEGLSLQAQSRTQARTGKKRNQNCIDYGRGVSQADDGDTVRWQNWSKLMCTRWVIARSFDERVWNNSIGGGDDVHGPTTAFQRRCALATDTPPPMAVTILWSLTPWPLGHSSCKQSKN